MSDYFEAVLPQEFSAREQRLWLEDLVGRLSGRPVWKCQEVEYWNHPDLPAALRSKGYHVCYQAADRNGYPLYLMISRSHTETALSLVQIVEELSSDEVVCPFEKFGEYYAQRNKRRGPGTYATIRVGPRWYMVSSCGMMKGYYRLIVNERPHNAVAQPSPSLPLTFEELRKRLLATRKRR